MFKITTTFALMKKRSNIFRIVLLLLIILFCSQVTTHFISDKQASYYEFSSGNNNTEDSLSRDTDPSDEDQMDRSFIYGLKEQPGCQISGLSILPFIDNVFHSVWQPPEIF
jgi:sortase (surface protein transpeptidase)